MLEEGAQVEIDLNALKTALKEIPNWKAPGIDGIHGFWFKTFTSVHDGLTSEMNTYIQKSV